jgi:WhiB family transcriptional regulator, redox-sensing transcriptional regulator
VSWCDGPTGNQHADMDRPPGTTRGWGDGDMCSASTNFVGGPADCVLPANDPGCHMDEEVHRFSDDVAVSDHGACSSPAAGARSAWVLKARCRSTDPDELFVRGAAQRKAAVICRHCPVIAECLADALDNQMEFGVWGGMTERQRRALLKQHPEVVSWSEFFAAQRKHRNTDKPA